MQESLQLPLMIHCTNKAVTVTWFVLVILLLLTGFITFSYLNV